jgi:uncharacterized protein
LFEKEPRLGGHTHTHLVETSRGVLPLDTGFIVHNDRTYPQLVRLFRALGVERQCSEMSFGVSCRRTGLEYSSRGLAGFFATRRNWLRLAHFALLTEILRFNRAAANLLGDPHARGLRLGDYLRAQRFSEDFKRYYLYPMASAVWSTALEEIDEFPALTLVRFFDNHGFLGINTHPQWYVLQGGSHVYIAPLTAPYRERIHLSARIDSVTRVPDGVHLCFADRATQRFDEVVFACHAPQTLALLGDASPLERTILGSFKTSRNEALLHTDENLLPRRPAARASWNYHLGTDPRRVALTYHLNRLQNLLVAEDYCLTLNLPEAVDQRKVLRAITYDHPLVTLDAVRAQTRWSEISGRRRAHFCGAYWFYGFHEDGLNSAIRVAESLSAPRRAADADGFRDLRRNAAASAISSSAA